MTGNKSPGRVLHGQVLHGGTGHGEVLVLDEPLSFWGGFDAASGRIIDTHHPQVGLCASGRVLAVAETRGSAATPGGIAEAVRRGTAPAAVVLVKPDVNVAVGAMVASALYGVDLPVIALSDAAAFARLVTGARARVAADGTLTLAGVTAVVMAGEDRAPPDEPSKRTC